MPTILSRPTRSVWRRAGAVTFAVAVALTAAAGPATAVPSGGDSPTVTGQACLPGQGVTVVVDFTQASDAYDGSLTGPVSVGCAIGEQKSIADAGKAAGFEFDAPGGFLQTINGVAPQAPGGAGVSAYWGLYTSTSDHLPDGPAATSWQYANVGIDGGPATVDTALLFQVEQYPSDSSRPFTVALADLPGYQPSGSSAPPASYPASKNGSAVAAATWLGTQMEASGYLLTSSGATDYGLTADGIIALAAAGVGKDVITASATKLYHSGTAYIGSADQASTKWGAIAKMALALQVAGLDPTAFPAGKSTRNLIDELRLAENPDGSFGAAGSDVPFTHSLALLALERTAGGVPPAAVTWLQQQQCASAGDAKGSYGYGGCDAADLDSTALTVQALLGAGVDPADGSVAKADGWMQSQQAKDGSLPGYAGPNTNSTGLGAQALLASGNSYHKAVASAAGYIGSLQVSCEAVRTDAFAPADLGAIAYGGADWTSGEQNGIRKADTDAWVRATSQALLGLGLPSLYEVTAAGASDLPAPETCPAPALKLGSSKVTAGEKITVTVTNLAPSATLTVTLHSSPVRLGTVTANTAGTASARFTVPADTVAGAHQIVVTGTDVDLKAALTVRAAPVNSSDDTPTASPTPTPSDTPHPTPSDESASSSEDELAATGVTRSTPWLAGIGALALLLGSALVFLAREERVARGRHHA